MKFISLIKNIRLKTHIEYFRLNPIKTNKIIFWSNNLKSYGCNPKYIAEYIKDNCPNKYDIVWAFNEETTIPEDLPKEFRSVRYFSLDFLKELHTAKIIVTNTRIAPALMFKKRKGQFYIQTWHSSLRLKKIESDTNLPQSYVDTAKKDSKNIDLLISGCKFSTDTFKRAFWYEGEILESGTPRCDILLKENSSIKLKVCKELGIDINSKILLFAPTFRKNYAENDLGLDYEALKASLEKKFGGSWTVIYRYHPNVIQKQNNKTNPDWLKNGTSYSDMQELIAVSDILITDYSSCMFDAGIKKIPCFLFAPDLEEYLKNERELYFDIRALPFPLAQNNNQLTEKIVNFGQYEYQNNIEGFLKETGSFEDGLSAKRICEVIEKITK